MTATPTSLPSSSIEVWGRKSGTVFSEKVAGERWVRWLYGNGLGAHVGHYALSGRLFSGLYGAWQSSSLSRRAIPGFIREFDIPMEQYEAGPFHSFNDFFARRFKPGARRFVAESGAMPAFAEARYFAVGDVGRETRLPVKGAFLDPVQFLGGEERARAFLGGPCLVARLCPVDYHRFHYPDAGRTLETRRLGGAFHSVNPWALQRRPDVLVTNERVVSILETRNFGRLAYVEVGAMAVGKIVQSHPVDAPFQRGEEKGYFLFGASTVALFGEPGRWTPDADLLRESSRGRETHVELGERVAVIKGVG